jgi:hypothetical protein
MCHLSVGLGSRQQSALEASWSTTQKEDFSKLNASDDFLARKNSRRSSLTMSTEFATAVALHAFASVPFKKTSLGGPMLTVQVMLLVKSILSLTIRWRASEEIGAAEE